MKKSLKTRFAPSPTGLMHFGSVRTALFNYLYALRHQGSFLLRIEDTDEARSTVEFNEAILSGLNWLGIKWQDGPFYQSERKVIYETYYQQLIQNNSVYRCFCTEQQLAITRKVQMAAHQPPRYPGTCDGLSEAEREAKRAAGIPYTLRFRVKKGVVIEFEDLIKGKQRFESDHIGDFIIRRQDNSASFMFCNAIDDSSMGVTHALRGDDHLTNTPRQLLILQALKLDPPQYGHFPTILGPDSQKLSKRNGSRSIRELEDAGYLPIALLNYLVRLGHHDADTALLDKTQLVEHFDLSHIGSSPAHYDEMQLNHWQKEAMHRIDWQSCWTLVEPFVGDKVPVTQRQAFIKTVQPNLVMPKDAVAYADYLFGEVLVFNDAMVAVIKEAGVDFFKTVLSCWEDETTTADTLLKTLQTKTNRKGKDLFFPVRAALTGEVHGPELAKILGLLGHEKVRLRFLKALEHAAHL
jgi:nondiscriminating glutamyl-tRNA synthetase